VTHVTYQLSFCDYGFGIADGRYALQLVALQPCASFRSVPVTHALALCRSTRLIFSTIPYNTANTRFSSRQSAVSKLVVLTVDTLVYTSAQNSILYIAMQQPQHYSSMRQAVCQACLCSWSSQIEKLQFFQGIMEWHSPKCDQVLWLACYGLKQPWCVMD